ncbi:MAG TPA: choice-of-anchor V domain-containing protein [Candidatus Saccharimonadaceae bacterium]|jgi:hypothetical protein|nr:choice-of-anchor V domain-containing protein [Candidatus Saccharimonadaceae bacterium]
MRHHIIRATAVAVLLGGAALARAYSFGPLVSLTGAFPVAGKPAEPNCTSCHFPTGSQNTDPNGTLHIGGIPTNYVAGASYPLTIELNYNWSQAPSPYLVKWGFQIQAVNSTTGDSAGVWLTPGVPPDSLQWRRYSPASSNTYKRRVYLEHTESDVHKGQNEDGQSGPIVWHVTWVAPNDSVKVYFFLAGNCGNGDSLHVIGDHIYTYADSTLGTFYNVSVPLPHLEKLVTSLDEMYPNPFDQCLGMLFTLGRPGLADLSIYDVQGRHVRTLVHEWREAGVYADSWDGRTGDGTQLKNGIYFVRLTAPGLSRPVVRKAIFSH